MSQPWTGWEGMRKVAILFYVQEGRDLPVAQYCERQKVMRLFRWQLGFVYIKLTSIPLFGLKVNSPPFAFHFPLLLILRFLYFQTSAHYIQRFRHRLSLETYTFFQDEVYYRRLFLCCRGDRCPSCACKSMFRWL